MRRLATLPLVFLLLLSSLVAAIPANVAAQEGTPVVPVADTVFPPVNVRDVGDWLLPQPFCTPQEIADGADFALEAPTGGALVRPASAPNQDLYLLEVTLPPNACIGYQGHYLHDGAIVWFVQDGTISFKAEVVVGLPAAEVDARRANGDIIDVRTMPVELEPGDWISVDRAANYTYRNTGSEDARILMAVLEARPSETMLPSDAGGSFLIAGGCKTRCRDKK